MRPRILFIDDEPNVLDAFRRSLREQSQNWEMHFSTSPIEALKLVEYEHFDAIVSDLRMPVLSGLQLLSKLQAGDDTRDIPVVIVTGEGERALRRSALDLGATDLLQKPVDREDLLARLRSALRMKQAHDELRQTNERLEQRVRERTAQLEASRTDIVFRLARAAEFRDEETGNHVLRVGCYSRTIAETLGLDAEFIETIFLAAPLHDIGKIGVPDSILTKPGKLTGPEWSTMRRHCDYGAEILESDSHLLALCRRLGTAGRSVSTLENPLLSMAAIIARTHHEKWDGSGYPHGLSATEIPLAARIVAVADVFDALRSLRPYKPAYTLDHTLDILQAGSGHHFDPEIYAAFEAAIAQILRLETELSDSTESLLGGRQHVERFVC